MNHIHETYHILTPDELDAMNAGLPEGLSLRLDEDGLALCFEDQVLRGDFSRLLPRIRGGALSRELLVKVSKIKNSGQLTAIDGTAGLGDDSFFLAAAGFQVTMFERNPVIYALLTDTLRRASEDPQLSDIVSRMTAVNCDSVEGMQQIAAELAQSGGEPGSAPDVVLLDPMFPARQKSALVKKKLQMIQKLETPCLNENALLLAAMHTRPKKLIIKRPPKGPYLGNIKPDHSMEGKAVRFDCIVSPFDRVHKFDL